MRKGFLGTCGPFFLFFGIDLIDWFVILVLRRGFLGTWELFVSFHTDLFFFGYDVRFPNIERKPCRMIASPLDLARRRAWHVSKLERILPFRNAH